MNTSASAAGNGTNSTPPTASAGNGKFNFNLRGIASTLRTRHRARQSFYEFFLQFGMRRVVKPIPAPHVKFVCDRIQQFIEDPLAGILVICIPPGGVKSQIVSQALPCWLMGRMPHCEVVAAANVTALAERNGRLVREIITQPDYAKTFTGVSLKPGDGAVASFGLTNGSKYQSFGVGAALFGYRADFLLADDLVATMEEIASASALNKIIDWFSGPFISRQKPGAKIILIQQRLHLNDPAGFLLHRQQLQRAGKSIGRRIDSIILPMEAEDNDPMGRAPGELLWPGHWSPLEIEGLKADPFRWKTLYQQRPASDGADWLDIDTLQFVDETPRDLTYRTCTDLAVSVNSGDYTVHLVVGTDSLKRVYVVDAWHGQVDAGAGAEQLFEFCRLYSPVELLIDDDNTAKGVIPILERTMRDRQIYPRFKMLPMRGKDKETRAFPLKELFRMKKIFFKRATWNDWLVRELSMFPNATGSGVDDGVDALGLIARRFAVLGGKAAPDADDPQSPPGSGPRAKTWQDETLAEMFEDKERININYGRLPRI